MESIVGKGENIGIKDFLLYTQCFHNVFNLVEINFIPKAILKFCAYKCLSLGQLLYYAS